MRGRWKATKPIYRGQKPTVVHKTLEAAFVEAARLSEIHPHAHYAVFECIGYVKGNKPVVSEADRSLPLVA